MKILVIQLARLGDILQTLPMIAGLKNKYPECTVDLVVREKFADAAKVSPHVDRIVAMPTRSIIGNIVDKGGNVTKEEKTMALAHLITWVADEFLEVTHRDGAYDLTLNCTFSESSSYLAQVIPSKEVRGLKRAKDGAYAVTDAWGTYIYSQVLKKNLNIIHLNDLFARMAEVNAAAVNPKMDSFDSSTDLGPLVIGMQMGASQSSKTLNPKSWSNLASELLKALPEAHLVLFGSRDDKKQTKELIDSLDKSISSRCTSLVGKLRFNHNVSWVKRCHFVITPDTAMVHLASLCGVKAINISVGGVNPHETGPYGQDHYVLRPRDTSFEVGMPILAEAVISIIMNDVLPQGIEISKTRIATCSDETTRNILEPVNFTQNEVLNLFQQSYYLLAEFRFGGRLEDIPVPVIGSSEQVDDLEALKVSIEAMETIRKLGDFGKKYCLKMIENPTDKAVLTDLGNRIGEIEKLFSTLRSSVFYVRPLVDLWDVQKENVIGDGIEELAGFTEGTFRELVQNVDMVHQLIQLALNAAEAKMKTQEERPAATQSKEI